MIFAFEFCLLISSTNISSGLTNGMAQQLILFKNSIKKVILKFYNRKMYFFSFCGWSTKINKHNKNAIFMCQLLKANRPDYVSVTKLTATKYQTKKKPERKNVCADKASNNIILKTKFYFRFKSISFIQNINEKWLKISWACSIQYLWWHFSLLFVLVLYLIRFLVMKVDYAEKAKLHPTKKKLLLWQRKDIQFDESYFNIICFSKRRRFTFYSILFFI